MCLKTRRKSWHFRIAGVTGLSNSRVITRPEGANHLIGPCCRIRGKNAIPAVLLLCPETKNKGVSMSIRNRLFTSSAVLALVLSASAHAQELVQNQPAGNLETVVVTGTQFNPDVAPAKSSLETTQPQTIINQSYIQDSTAETADYTTILGIAPSMTGMSLNGPGLSDGNVKNTLRGLSDGNFVMQYDGVPFGDTNGPSHHSESYFPGATIGSIVVDRGPGNAGNMGAATYGGTVKMFSETVMPDAAGKVTLTGGSWGTGQVNLNYQTGDYDLAGTKTRALVNILSVSSDGYLTFQNTSRQNLLVKIQSDLGNGWTLTLFGNYNGLFQHVNDKNGATPAQIVAYGEQFALQTTNPALGTYQAYNGVHKKTDLDYLRLEGDIGSLHVDNQFYSYAYVNKTFSATNIQQTAADIAAGKTEGLGTVVGGVAFKSDVPGYTKKNAYRVWGDMFRVSQDYDFGWLTGQVRAGIWWETQATQRGRWDYDMTKCFADPNGVCNPWRTSGAQYADSTLVAKTKAKGFTDAVGTTGFAEYVEHSNWNQYEPFIEVDIKPLEDLTITPGFKYVSWDRSVNAPLEQKTVPVVPVSASFTTTRALPFLTANYKIEPSWSVYAQYAQGIYVPDISSFEQAVPTTTFPKAQTTANYQVGSVFYADNFSIDADVYYIAVNNNIVFQACNLPPFNGSASETCALNTGRATYQGVEGQGTYAFDGWLSGLSGFASGSYNSARTGHLMLSQAPLWTIADGLVYKTGIWKISLIDKVVGPQYSDNANTPFYKIHTYNNTDLKVGMVFGDFELGVGIYNLFNERNLLAVGINDKKTTDGGIASSVYDITHRGASLDQYYYAPPTNFQVTLKASF